MSNPANEHHAHYVLRQCGPAWLAVDPDNADPAGDLVTDGNADAHMTLDQADTVPYASGNQRVTRRWRDSH
ncbi:hypothetical protein IGB42_02284 [Andreprevotia sp. IGB-42]|uniref:hypothetical protein n=1 Tax=Andreprevotia sp. IGB-42 TaxID=2497473 RepID=UPI001356DAC5|nr:hypothetical protein [Andreprevotia sp. IGB-42]KAF0813355.1 hypothetical protein IGB42_02284 [Andreprevotia sp. IGB-42]